jgi:hypothetical protein
MAQSTDVPSGFAAQLIAALEDAQASASTAKPRNQLAQAAWSKLQFDFLVSAAPGRLLTPRAQPRYRCRQLPPPAIPPLR